MNVAIRRDAVIDESGLYRYRLTREWSPEGAGCKRICWIMLNPSTADGLSDDPTIRKCIGFTQRLGFNALVVVNVFAWRATDPADLVRAARAGEDVIGERNHTAVRDAADQSSLVICAWGAGVELVKLGNWNLGLERHPQVRCLGRTKSGQPRHPLMLPYSAQLEAWP